MKLQIKGGRLLMPAASSAQSAAAPSAHLERRADLFIVDGLIAGIGSAPAEFLADRVIDADGLCVAPGLVDLSARLTGAVGAYGEPATATLESELSAALAGGVTTLVCPPDTDPVLDQPALVRQLKSWAEQLNQARVYPLGALTVGLKGTALSEMRQLTEAGCIGFSQAAAPLVDTQVLWRALDYASTYGYPVWLRPQDPFLSRGGVAASGAVASRLGLAGIPAAAETIAVQTILELMRMTGARVHLQHLSAAASIALVRAAKREGLALSCDVTLNHLHLIDADIAYFDPQYRIDPPLRSQRDRDAIHAGLLDGTIDALCSGHTPLSEQQKLLPFGTAVAGASGLELLLSMTVKWAQQSRLPLAQALACITRAPAALLGLAAGRLESGAPADLCIFDPESYWTIDAGAWRSQGRNTPFNGYEVPGRVRTTVLGGQVVFEQASL
jgi:dihydroorotase